MSDSIAFGDQTIKVALARDLLRKIMTTPVDGRGELPFPPEEQQWALDVYHAQPEWAKPTLQGLGMWKG